MLARFVVCSAFCLLIVLQPCALLFGGDGKTSAEERPTKRRRLNPEQTGVMPAPLATQVVSPLPIVVPMDSKASHTPLAVTVEPLQEAASATESLPDVLLGTQEELIAFMQRQTLVLKSLEEKQARQLDNFLQLKDITVEEQACQELLLQNMPQLECAKVVGCYALRKLALTQLPVIEELTVEHSGVRDTFTIDAHLPSLRAFTVVDCDSKSFNVGHYPNLQTFKTIDYAGKVCTINFQPKASV